MECLEILAYQGEGYKPLVHYEGWRVAVINYAERFDEANLHELERHHLTDEVFVLLSGSARLVIGGNGERPEDVKIYPMEKNKVYNVKKDGWHHILVSQDVCVLVVENDDTSRENSKYATIGQVELNVLFEK